MVSVLRPWLLSTLDNFPALLSSLSRRSQSNLKENGIIEKGEKKKIR